MAELLTTYASLRLQVVDACVVALAERLDVREVAALDRRDFLVVAPGTCAKDSGSPCCLPTDPLDRVVRCAWASGVSMPDLD
jgi:hypothetical protein